MIDRVGALVGERERVHVALAKARRGCRPLRASPAPARSISDERSMPIAWLARGPNSSIIRPVPVPMSTSRPSGALAKRQVDRALDLAFGDMERADLVPHLGMAGEIAVGGFGALGADGLGARRVGCEQGLRSRRRPRRRPVRTSARRGRGSASVRKTQLPSLRRSSTPASARILRWRETRGWLCPRTCASSPTDSSISRSSATMRSRVGSASAWNRSASGRRAVTR